jgi:VCBS repeat-containing protein
MTDNSIQLDSGGSVLFVGNSFTFGRVDPVMSYNSDNVRDLTAPVPGTTFANTTGSNPYEPHPWGGVPGIFEAFASQSGLELDVAISARNAATLQGQYLNSNPAGWDLRGNVASQSWDTVVLQDNSTQALPSGTGSITFAAGSSTATLIIHPTADTKVETDETIGLQVTANSAYRTSSGVVTGTVMNDDPTGPVVNPNVATVTLVASPGAVLEDGTQKLVYTFTRSGPTTSALTVNFAAARDGSTAPSVATGGDFENNANQFTNSFQADNGQATTGNVSFTSNTGSVVIPAGATSVTFTLDPRPDTTVENDESIRLTLSANANYNVGTQGAVYVTILNDDFAAGTDTSLPNISLSLAASAVYENAAGDLVYVFTRTGSNTDPLTVNFNVSGTATLPGNDFTVTGANSFSTAGAADPSLASFNTYAVKLAQYATSGAADGSVPANPHANAATDVYLYETWARPNMVTGAVVANTDDTTGAVTNTATTAPEYYTSLETMTADLRAAYEGLAAANPIFAGVAPVGAAFLAAVQNGTATRDPYAPDAGADGKVDLWWDDNLHASKYGSYLSGLTLFGTLTGLDPRSLGAAEHVAADLGITPAEAAALQDVAAATLGFSLDAHWTAPGKVTELQGGVTGLLATAGAFGFSDSDLADTHTVTVTPLTPGSIGTFTAALRADTTGDGTGGAVNWLFTVDNADVAFLAPGATRVEHFLVTISDAHGGSAQRDIAVTISGSYNDAPVAANDFAVSQLAGISVDAPGVLGNDTDPEADPLVVSAVNGLGVNVGVPTAGTYGHLNLLSDGHYSYLADNSAALALAPTGSHLHDNFSYAVSDGHGGTASATLDITLNRGPAAVADTAIATGIGGTASGNLLANDGDADGDGLAAAAGTLLGSHGTLVLGANGGYTYTVTNLTGAAGSHLHDIFNYTVSDGYGGTAGAALDITLNRGPVAAADTATATTGIGGTASGNVLANDRDADGDSLTTVAGTLIGSHGALVLGTNGGYTYTVTDLTGPAGNHLHDIFNYTVSDGHGGTASAALDVTLNRGPVAVTDTVVRPTTGFAGFGSWITGNLLANDSDADGDGLTTAAGVMFGSRGILLLGANGDYNYILINPFGAAGSHVQDSFNYTVSDGHGGTASAALNIIFNRGPNATADAAMATAGVGGTAAGNLLANDTDADGDTLTTAAGTLLGSHGALVLGTDGGYTYTVTNLTGAAGRHLHDIFSYTANDGYGGTDSATLDVTLNRGPTATADTAKATAGVGGTASGNLLANDSDADGDGLTTAAGTLHGSHGTLVLGKNGGYTYTVTDLTGPAGSHLHDSFSYTVSDGHGGTAGAALDITLDRDPIAANDSIAVAKGGNVHGNVLTNDSDPDGDAIGVTGIVGGSCGRSIAGTYGTFTLNTDGSYTYVATKGGLPSQIVPQDTFSYTVGDGHGGDTMATVTFVVLNSSQSYQAGANTTLNGGNGQDVLDGSSGHDVLLGGNGADVLIGGMGDRLTGGSGPDTFLFRPDFGANTITDFDVNNDTVQIAKSVFHNLSDLFAHTSNSAAGAVINDGEGNTITFTGVTVAQLHAHQSDFHLV